MTATTTTWAIAASGAAIVAAAGVAAAWVWGADTGMPVVALGTTLWTAGFVRWSATRRRR